MGGSFRERVAPLYVPVIGTELAAPLLDEREYDPRLVVMDFTVERSSAREVERVDASLAQSSRCRAWSSPTS
jgi:hypothetical protein